MRLSVFLSEGPASLPVLLRVQVLLLLLFMVLLLFLAMLLLLFLAMLLFLLLVWVLFLVQVLVISRYVDEVHRLESEPCDRRLFDRCSATLRWPAGVSEPKFQEGAGFAAVYDLSAS